MESADKTYIPCALQFRSITDNRYSFKIWPHIFSPFFRETDFYLGVVVRRRNTWILKRNTFPVGCLEKIYNLFTRRVGDVLKVIYQIYDIIETMCNEYHEREELRLQRYKEGDPDIDLFSEEEDFFLTQEERNEYRERKEKILARMIPPKVRKGRSKRRKRRSSADSDYGISPKRNRSAKTKKRQRIKDATKKRKETKDLNVIGEQQNQNDPVSSGSSQRLLKRVSRRSIRNRLDFLRSSSEDEPIAITKKTDLVHHENPFCDSSGSVNDTSVVLHERAFVYHENLSNNPVFSSPSSIDEPSVTLHEMALIHRKNCP